MWKLWKVSGSKDKYLDAKWKAQHAAFTAKRNAEKENFTSVNNNKENLFHVTKQMCTGNQYVIGEKCIQGDDGNLSLDDVSKKLAWSQNLPHVDGVAGPAQFVIPDDVLKSPSRTKNGKVAGLSGVAAEMLKAAPNICSKIITNLMNAIIREGKIPADWSLLFIVDWSLLEFIIVNLFKGKGDALDWNNYCGLKLTGHVLKVIERIVGSITCETVNIDQIQFGFCPG